MIGRSACSNRPEAAKANSWSYAGRTSIWRRSSCDAPIGRRARAWRRRRDQRQGACGATARYRQSPGGPGAQTGHSTGSRRKRPGSRWCVGRAHWPAALSSEQSCGSPYMDARARRSRCPQPVCAGVRTCGEFQGLPPTPPCPKRPGTLAPWGGQRPGSGQRHWDCEPPVTAGSVAAIVCQPARKSAPQSACKSDPPVGHGGLVHALSTARVPH